MKLIVDYYLQQGLVDRKLSEDTALAGLWRQRLEPVYQMPPETRAQGFLSVYKEVFEEYGLGEPVTAILAEFPFTRSLIEVLVIAAANRQDETVEISRDHSRLGIKLLPQRFNEGGKLHSFLRHELMHLDDMLEPAFGYREESLSGLAATDNKLVGRYRLLWDIYIDGRLTRQAREGGASQEVRQRDFERVFLFLPRRQRLAAFQGLWSAVSLTHSQLWEIAQSPAQVAHFAQEEAATVVGLSLGSLCPLCHFPTYDWAQPEAKVIPLIRADFVWWAPEEGICQRCYEYYNLKEREEVLWR